jgi:phage shock protein PspC (stress-responsive transcriptional regulator)
MKKTISIHLMGINFLLEENAYELVRNYLDRLQESLRNSKDQQEISQDVELRIAELASQILTEQKKQVLTLEEMQQILATLGQPEEFLEEDETNEIPRPGTGFTDPSGSRRLFRDPQEGLLGGVCTGLAAYFRVDVVLIRILFVVAAFFAGFAVAAYLILWVVVPAVSSNLERLQMQGRPVNLGNLKDEFNDAIQRGRRNSRNFENEIRDPNSPVRQRMDLIWGFAKRIIGLGFLILGGIFLIFVIYFSFVDISLLPFNDSEHILSLDEVGELFLVDRQNAFNLWISLLIAGIVSVLLLMLNGASLLFSIRSKWKRPVRLALIIILIISIGSAVLQGIRTGRDFAINGEVEHKIGDVRDSILTVQIHSDYRNDFVKNDNDFGHNAFEVSGNDLVEGGIDVYYAASTDSLFHVYAEYSARGETHQKAVQRSTDIRHAISISGQILTISPHYKFPKKDKMRDQSVRLIIQIPPHGKVDFPDQQVTTRQVNDWGFIRKNEQYEHYPNDETEEEDSDASDEAYTGEAGTMQIKTKTITVTR